MEEGSTLVRSVCLGCRKEKRQKECAASLCRPLLVFPFRSAAAEEEEEEEEVFLASTPRKMGEGGRKRKGISPALSQFGAAATSAGGGAIQLRSREGIKGTLLLFPSATQ